MNPLIEQIVEKSGLTLHQIQNTEVVIIGQPASGKTHLANLLKGETQKLYHTDDYIKFGYEQSIYALLDDLNKENKQDRIIEGVGCYRLLRKGVETGRFFPKLVINMVISESRAKHTYSTERDISKYKGVETMIKGNNTVLGKYILMDNPHTPIIINCLNNW
jgi:energy-coupling factor transporter ATP-binding protein EcfA2